VLMQYNDIVYTPGKKETKVEFKEKDKVLEKALEVLSGKISLEEAKEISQKQAQERKAKKDKEEKPASKEDEAKK